MLERGGVVIVQELFDTLDSQAEVLVHLRQDRSLTEPLKLKMIALAEARRRNPNDLNQKSWVVVRDANAAAPALKRAVRQAREACRLEPENGLYLNTLGIGPYRSGQYKDALEILTLSEKLNTAIFKEPHPADLAFLAMAQHRLGNREEQKTLERLRQAIKNPRWVNDEESKAFLQESEKLLQESAQTPQGK